MKKTLLLLACGLALLASAQTKPNCHAPHVSILGDSYSTFEGYLQPDTNEIWYFARQQDCTDVTRVDQMWWYQLLREKGWRLERNNSYSGATIGFRGYHGDDYKPRSFITRHDNLGSPDMIFVCGATNDSWCGEKIGDYKYENISDSDCYTFRPAMARFMQELTTRYVNVPIYFVLNCDLKPDFMETVRVVCRRYGVPCIELHDIDKQNGHPTIKGQRQMADQVKAFIDAENTTGNISNN